MVWGLALRSLFALATRAGSTASKIPLAMAKKAPLTTALIGDQTLNEGRGSTALFNFAAAKLKEQILGKDKDDKNGLSLPAMIILTTGLLSKAANMGTGNAMLFTVATGVMGYFFGDEIKAGFKKLTDYFNEQATDTTTETTAQALKKPLAFAPSPP